MWVIGQDELNALGEITAMQVCIGLINFGLGTSCFFWSLSKREDKIYFVVALYLTVASLG